jgi:DNA-directed RNA polymerase subunit K/omega
MDKTLDETDATSVKSDDDNNYNSDTDKEGPTDPTDNPEDIESENEGADSDIESIGDIDEEPEGEEPLIEVTDSEQPNELVGGETYDAIILDNEEENVLQIDQDEDEDDDDSLSESYEEQLQKLDKSYKEDIVEKYHKEEFHINHDEMLKLCQLNRNDKGFIIDPLHKTTPILSKYEYTNILGIRAKQLSDGAPPLIEISEEIIDNYIIADIELRQKVLPFIIKRPLGHGGCEYWRIGDLEILL